MAGTKINAGSRIQGSIIGWKNKIGKWVRIDGLTVTAEDVEVKDEIYLNAIMVLPHKPLTQNYPNAGTIVM